ncbi:MAG: sugar transferase [Solobacterium sp.]|nr:sugar transferase [Solobacterium sp.]
MQYYIDLKRKKRNTAGAKAPADINAICASMGMESFFMPKIPDKNKVLNKAWLFTVPPYYWMKLRSTCKSGDVVIFQHPMYGNRITNYFLPSIQKKGVRFIAVIHDLESLRHGISGILTQSESTSILSDNVLLKKFNYVIAHNQKMKEYLISQGFAPDKVGTLDIFDYLYDGKTEKKEGISGTLSVAGNLAPAKSGYIYQLGELAKDFHVNLYGNNFDKNRHFDHVTYKGSFLPEELPLKIEGDFGLIWDGPSAKTCEGNTGNYLRYNNPHKTSLYLASGIPVIVWKESAMADFVLKNQVGYVIDNLEEINAIYRDLNEDEYREIKNNTLKIAEKLKSGYYFKKALNQYLQQDL